MSASTCECPRRQHLVSFYAVEGGNRARALPLLADDGSTVATGVGEKALSRGSLDERSLLLGSKPNSPLATPQFGELGTPFVPLDDPANALSNDITCHFLLFECIRDIISTFFEAVENWQKARHPLLASTDALLKIGSTERRVKGMSEQRGEGAKKRSVGILYLMVKCVPSIQIRFQHSTRVAVLRAQNGSNGKKRCRSEASEPEIDTPHPLQSLEPDSHSLCST
uniref:Uncharacterized protein n=1 Tax=Ascaris lumbricoides TaxID=6252 RepID=A0A0M3HT56_ASCLU